VPNGAIFTLMNGTTSITVSYSTATITPAEPPSARVISSRCMEASAPGPSPRPRQPRDLEDAEFEPAEGQEFGSRIYQRIHGPCPESSRCRTGPYGRRSPRGSKAARPSIWTNNVKVEAEGHLKLRRAGCRQDQVQEGAGPHRGARHGGRHRRRGRSRSWDGRSRPMT